MTSFESLVGSADRVFGSHPSAGLKIKASQRTSLSDSLTASWYTRFRTGGANNATAVSVAPKFKLVRDAYSVDAAVFADSSAAPQIELGTTIFNFVVQGVRQTLSFATPSFGANGKSVEAKPTLTTSTRYFAEAVGATFDVTADFVNASGSVAVALPLPEGVVGGAKAQLDQASGLKSFDVAVRLGASGLTLLGKGLLAGAVGAAAPVWSATYYSRLSQTLAVGAEADSLRYVRVGALHDATPFTSVRVKLDNNSRAAIAADTVLSSALTASLGVDFDLNNRRDLKWGVSLKFA